MKPPALDPIALPLRSVALIEASAGTGKTFTITTLYVRLVLEGLEVPRILVVTYTNAATAELRDRVRRRLHEALRAFAGDPPADETLAALVADHRANGREAEAPMLLLRALRSFDEAAIFTIHGFCQRMLHDHAFESRVSFDAELVGDQDLLRDEVVRDFWAREVAKAPRWFVDCHGRHKASFEALSKLARKVAEDPKLVVVPGEAAAADEGAALSAWMDAWERAATLWKSERGKVIALLDQPDVLHKVPYSEADTTLIPLLDSELAAPRRWILQRFEKIECLTPSVLVKKTRVRRVAPRHPFFDACGALVEAERALEAVASSLSLRLRLDLVAFVRREIAERKERANVQSFDDLLHRLDEALGDGSAGDGAGAELAGRIRAQFSAALIDEFQDTDPAQYSIFRKIYLAPPAAAASGVTLFLIGDPKQAIYSFRGADVFAYMGARADARDGEWTLGTNWRSDPSLIRAVNTLFSRPPRPFVFDDIPFQGVAPQEDAEDRLAGSAAGAAPFEILLIPGEKITKGAGEDAIPGYVAAEVSRFLQSGARLRTPKGEREIGPGGVAVLCRTNKQAKLTHEALQKLAVPAVLYGDSSVFDTDDALEVERVLRAMVEPGDQGAIRAALVTRLFGLGADELEKLRDDETQWDEIVREFAALSETWRTRGFVSAFRRMLEGRQVEARLLRFVDGERRLTNVLHLGELLQNAAVDGHRGPLALVEWLNRMRHDRAARGDLAPEATQIRLESDARRVKLTTIHQAKGLEYEVVYCPFLWTGIYDAGEVGFTFHDPDAENERRYDIGSPEREAHAELYEREELAECLRLLYVALTRAKHRCSIVWGWFADGRKSALGYLLHRPAMPAGDAAAKEVFAAVGERIASPDLFRSDLDRIVALAKGAIAVLDLPVEEGPPYVGPAEVEEIVPPRVAARRLDDGWRTSSFTRLAAGRGAISAVAEMGVDHDEIEEEALAAAPVVLADFPKGARAGELFHEILEHLDFAATRAEIGETAAETLDGHGFDAGKWKEAVTSAIVALLETPLGGTAGSFRLRDLAKERRLSEMEFIFPVAERDAASRLTPARLASVFRRHGAPAAAPAYADRVERLGFPPLAGFLRGFVDLVFEHDGRWYVLDWKSNLLGPVASAYAPARLAAAMESHHYVLQYHLYAVALHRHLRSRLRGYEPAWHFGGAYYLFLRGISSAHPAGTGIFHDRPPVALVEELSELLHGTVGAAGGARLS